MNSLPNEILMYYIFPYLYEIDNVSSLKNCALVCHKWAQIAATILYKEVFLHDPTSIHLFQRTLELDNSSCTVDFGDCIRNIYITISEVEEMEEVSDEEMFEEDNFEDLLILKHLKQHYPMLFSNYFYQLIGFKCKKLTGLILTNCVVTSSQFHMICSLNSLETLIISDIFGYPDSPHLVTLSDLLRISNLCNLKVLKIGSRNINDIVLNCILNPKMKRIDLIETGSISDESILQIAKTCSQLQFLGFSDASRQALSITNHSIQILVQSCPCLIRLGLQSTEITDSALEYISNHCENLETINLSWCHKITLEGIVTNLFKMTSLRTIYCHGCKRVNTPTFYRRNSIWNSF